MFQMKLIDLKAALVEYFFKPEDLGVNDDQVVAVVNKMAARLNIDVEDMLAADLRVHGNLSDPSKAFKKFTEERRALLVITDEDDRAIFVALRSGNEIWYKNLTVKAGAELRGSLLIIKTALRQGKNRNDDINFNIQNES